MDATDAAAALREARAAELHVTADTRANPWWVWPSIGAVAALFVASFDLVGSTPWVALSTVLYAAAIGVIVGALNRRRGTQARLSRLPAELRRQIVVFALGGGAVMAVGVLIATTRFDGPPRFTVVGLIIGLVTVLSGRFADSRYIAAARRLRAEAGM